LTRDVDEMLLLKNCATNKLLLIRWAGVFHFVGYFSEISSKDDILDRVQVNKLQAVREFKCVFFFILHSCRAE